MYLSVAFPVWLYSESFVFFEESRLNHFVMVTLWNKKTPDL